MSIKQMIKETKHSETETIKMSIKQMIKETKHSETENIKMSTLQMIKETQISETETFECVLNASQKTEQESLTFVKKLLTIGLSSITYLRNVLPEGAYINKKLEGLELKILNQDTDCMSALLLINYINASFEAIEKKYLRRLTLNIEDSRVPEKIIESFAFSFSYPETGEYIVDELRGVNYSSVNCQNEFNVKKPTVKMLRTVILLSQALGPLPENVRIDIELQYYENVTPPNYEPKGFAPIINSSRFEEEHVNIKVGKVATKYHTVDLKCKTTNFMPSGGENSATDEEHDFCGETESGGLQSQPLDEDIFDTLSEKAESNLYSDRAGFTPVAPKNNFTIESVIKSLGEKDLLETCLNTDINKSTTTTPHQSNLSTPCVGSVVIRTGSAGSAKSCSQNSESFENEFFIRCPCGISFDQGIMILCDVCNYWQHGACFNIISEKHAPARHICEKCADPPSICTEPRLTSTDLPLVSATCVYRRTLVILEDLKDSTITQELLMQYLGCNEALTSGLIMKTIREGITRQNGDSDGYSIDKHKLLKEAFPKYLRSPEEHPSPHHVDNTISELNITSSQEADFSGFLSSDTHVNNFSDGCASLQGKRKNCSDYKENRIEDSPQDIFNQEFSRKKTSYRSMSKKILTEINMKS